MAGKTICIAMLAIVITSLTTIVVSDDNDPIPSDPTQVQAWFDTNIVQNVNSRKSIMDPELVQAEESPITITVRKDGEGNSYKTVTEAIASIPEGNNRRYIVAISGGTYFEKIKINRSQRFVTLLGSPGSIPTLEFNDTAKSAGGTVSSATVAAYGDYFVANNIIFKNSAPQPGPGENNRQALAFGAFGNKATLYNSDFISFQDTIGDETVGKHVYKHYYMYCNIYGGVDFVWGHGRALFVNSNLFVVPAPGFNRYTIVANYKEKKSRGSGFSFVQCNVRGDVQARTTYLGRSLTRYATVIYSYTTMSNVIMEEGWTDGTGTTENISSDQAHISYNGNAFYREYKNSGEGAAPDRKSRGCSIELDDEEAKQFISLSYIEGSKWLLPPPSL